MGLLLEHLRQKERAGQTHVWLSSEAREVMRSWHRAQRGGPRAAGAPPGEGARARPGASDLAGGGRAAGAAGPSRASGVASVAAAAAAAAPPPVVGWPEGAAEDGVTGALAAVRAGVLACPVYAALRQRGALRETMVFAAGHPASPLVLVGGAPGAAEEGSGEPFAGSAGTLLTKMITAMGLERSKVYVTYCVKYRLVDEPGDQGDDYGRPLAEAFAAGLPHLRKELAALRPRVLVALGAAAFEGLSGESLPIAQARGHWRLFDGIPLMPTLAPGQLAASDSLSDRRHVWEDMLQVMEKLGLPISAKQRAYFRT
jgi:uracil-DNA glycosylase family 4